MSDQLKAVKPLADRVALKRIERDEITKGGIIIPKNVDDRELAWQGEVMAVGSGKILEDGTRSPIDVQVGDKVLVGRYTGTELTVDGDKIVVVREDDILGVVEA